jgi:phosphatidylglycerol:prolipoprotein diacylglycerol transferase
VIEFPNISPEIFSINVLGVHLALRWYAMAYILGLILAWRIAYFIVSRQLIRPRNQAPLDPVQLENLLTYCIMGVIFGGRIGYVVFYGTAYYTANPIEILMLWKGGMAFHGGVLGVILGAYLFYRKTYTPLLSGADLLALATPVGLLLGRIANFINAELWGRPTDLPWGVIFPGQVAQSCGQIVDLCARHPSQLYEALVEGLLLGALLIYLAFHKGALKRPGFIFGKFFVSYGIARSIIELVRRPNTQFTSSLNPIGYVIQFGEWRLTMGQLLSIPMILIGLILISHSKPVSA